MKFNAVVEICAACHRPAEAPFNPLVDTAGQITPWVLCLDCLEVMDNRRRLQLPRPDGRADFAGES